MKRSKEAEEVRQELHKERVSHVAKIQEEQRTRKIELAEIQEVAQRKLKQDSIDYNSRVTAEERYKQQVISKRNRDIDVFNNKVKELFTFQPGERLICLFVCLDHCDMQRLSAVANRC